MTPIIVRLLQVLRPVDVICALTRRRRVRRDDNANVTLSNHMCHRSLPTTPGLVRKEAVGETITSAITRPDLQEQPI